MSESQGGPGKDSDLLIKEESTFLNMQQPHTLRIWGWNVFLGKKQGIFNSLENKVSAH